MRSLFRMTMAAFAGFAALFATVGIAKADPYSDRRALLTSRLRGGVVVLKAADEVYRNADSSYPFRQDSGFYYLTGLEEPGAYLVLAPGAARERFVLFLKVKSAIQKSWSGSSVGLEEAKRIYGADEAYPVARLEEKLAEYLADARSVHPDLGDRATSELVFKLMRDRARTQAQSGQAYSLEFSSVRSSLDELRLIKSADELVAMQKAIDITLGGIREGIRAARAPTTEYGVNAAIQAAFLRAGSYFEAFTSIVAAGVNATVLHYRGKAAPVRAGELMLLDLGAEYQYYAADVSRTFPVDGKFTPEQREIYDLVYRAQEAAMQEVAPGVSFRYLQARTLSRLTEGLFRLGLVTAPDAEWQARLWYNHGLGHWLGLDTHDCGSIGLGAVNARPFLPGMTLTIEPGLYIAETKLDSAVEIVGSYYPQISAAEIAKFVERVRPVARRYQGIGVRIEDDVVVTPTGYRLLSGGVPRATDEIESLVRDLR